MGKARSGADGRFSIGGARSAGFHGIAIDPGGGRYTLRAVDMSLEPGTEKDMGDIVLEPGGVVVGTVVDEDGDPVRGARVRFAPVPEIVVQSGALDLRGDSLVGVDTGEEMLVLDPLAKLRVIIDRLPASTGSTDAEGKFRIDGVPLGRVTGGADAPGLVAGPVEGITVAAGSRSTSARSSCSGRTIWQGHRRERAAGRRCGGARRRAEPPDPRRAPPARRPHRGRRHLRTRRRARGGPGLRRGSQEFRSGVGHRQGPGDRRVHHAAPPTLAPLRVEVVDLEGSRSAAPGSPRSRAPLGRWRRDGHGEPGDAGDAHGQDPKTRGAEEVEPGVYLVEGLPRAGTPSRRKRLATDSRERSTSTRRMALRRGSNAVPRGAWHCATSMTPQGNPWRTSTRGSCRPTASTPSSPHPTGATRAVTPRSAPSASLRSRASSSSATSPASCSPASTRATPAPPIESRARRRRRVHWRSVSSGPPPSRGASPGTARPRT